MQIVRGVWEWKNFESRLKIREGMDKSKVPRFYGPRCISLQNILCQHAEQKISNRCSNALFV